VNTDELILCTNGPGELYTWAGPMLRAVRKSRVDLRVVLSLLPCPFASGQELRIARDLGFDAVTTVPEYLAFAAGGPRPAAYQGSSGLVLQLGGDAMHAVRIAQRLKRPVWRYSFEPYWNAGLEKLFVHDLRTLEKAQKSSPHHQLENIGNLTADALAFQTPAPKLPGLDVLIMAGSRRFEVIHMLGLFAAVAERIAARLPEVRFHWSRSKLLTDQALEVAFSAQKVLDVGGVAVRLEGNQLVTPDGVTIHIADEEERYGLMKTADLALTIPGTNTLELGIAGVPSVVCLPLQKPELIPIEGPLQYIAAIPVLGPWLKRKAALAVLSKYKFVALPNMIADEAIQPELRGDVTPEWIANESLKLLESPEVRTQIRSRLEATMPKPGAANRLAERVIERLEPGAVTFNVSTASRSKA
jgi:Lipid-A-disaccharide synthetase